MPDLVLVPTSPLGVEGDIAGDGSKWLETNGLETAVRLSLFTDARALPGDVLPAGEQGFGVDVRGWWGEAFVADSSSFGSRLWLLARSTLTQATRQQARDYCLEALAWLVELGIARSVELETEVASGGFLHIKVTIYREREAPARFSYLWER